MAKLLGDGALIVWADLDPAVQGEIDQWYVEEHIPERITEAGYLRGRRYCAVSGGPAYMTMFEGATPASLASDGYRKVTANINPRSRNARAAFQRCIRSTHEVLATHGGASGGVMLCVRLDFADDAQRKAFADWARGQLAGWAAAFPAVLAAHVLGPAREVRERMDSFRATGQQDEWADGVLLLELGRASDFDAALAAAVSRASLAAAGIATADVNLGVYQLMVEFAARDMGAQEMNSHQAGEEEAGSQGSGSRRHATQGGATDASQPAFSTVEAV